MEGGDTEVTQNTDSEVIWMRDIERNIVQSAIARNPFFTLRPSSSIFHICHLCAVL